MIDYKKWAESLRSGKYKQTFLFGNEERCCALGCLYFTQFRDQLKLPNTYSFRELLTKENLMSNEEFDHFVFLNDWSDKTFSNIADIIENEYVKDRL